MKPTKQPYPDQDTVWKEAMQYVTPLIQHPGISEAYVWGSLAKGTFGIYAEPYEGELGSDIDLIVVVNGFVPENWRDTGVKKPWFDLYHIGTFSYKGIEHRIDGLLVFPDRHSVERMRARVAGEVKQIYP